MRLLSGHYKRRSSVAPCVEKRSWRPSRLFFFSFLARALKAGMRIGNVK